MAIRTSLVSVAEIFDLRWSVLRAGMPRQSAVFSQDADPGVFHLAAYPDGTDVPGGAGAADPVAARGAESAGTGSAGAPLACVTFFPEPFPEATGTVSYRFRGLASAPEVRGGGYGVAVLRAGVAEAAARGAELVWCHGRNAARGFYEREGFTVVGPEFQLPPAGPHHLFVISTGRAPTEPARSPGGLA